MANFRNYFNEEINLEGDWRVAVSEIIFPSKINQVNTNHVIKYSAQDYKFYQKSKPEGAVSKPYRGQRSLINTGIYENLDHIVKASKTATALPNFSYQYNKITGVLILFLGKNEGITFSDKAIQSILGFKGIQDGSGTHIGYKMLEYSENLLMKDDDETKAYVVDYPFDILAENN